MGENAGRVHHVVWFFASAAVLVVCAAGFGADGAASLTLKKSLRSRRVHFPFHSSQHLHDVEDPIGGYGRSHCTPPDAGMLPASITCLERFVRDPRGQEHCGEKRSTNIPQELADKNLPPIAAIAVPVCFPNPVTDVGTPIGMNNETEGYLTPTKALANCKSWVDQRMRYSQKKFYNGYRLDCSGFIALAWGLSVNPWTQSFSNFYNEIDCKDLRTGDVLNFPGHHIVLFHHWHDNRKTTFTAWEQWGTKRGCTESVRILAHMLHNYHCGRYKFMKSDAHT